MARNLPRNKYNVNPYNVLRLALFRGIQGTESLWLDSQLSVVDVPSRDWSHGGNRDFVQGQSINN
jgi:hypothetical protein